jgi:predicted Zn finger-like uncharacterized protein
MALATQCPYCHTTFRVAHDQLKLRAGLVRCGACKQIFNGIENLLRPEQTEPTAMPAPSPATTSGPLPQPAEKAADAAPAANPESTVAEYEHTAEIPAQSAPTGDESDAADADDQAAAADPLLRMTLMDFTHVAQRPAVDAAAAVDADAKDAAAEGVDPLEKAIDDLERKPWRETASDTDVDGDALDRADDSAYEEPGFVKRGRRRQRLARASRIVMAVGLPLLLLALLAQAAYTWRDQLAARFPQTKPMLTAACERIGCRLGLPAQIEAVTLESSELQALAPERNLFSLVALLRNRSNTVQAWPSIELTLNDANERPVARRVLAPRDYLSAPQDIDRGLPSASEQVVKLAFELPQTQASGYRVYLFYP